jgi:hypothetical protein
MRNRENIQDLRQKIDLYFDNALPPKDQEELMMKVDQDPRCSKMFNKEKTFRDFIKNNVKRTCVSPDIIQSIRDSIRKV